MIIYSLYKLMNEKIISLIPLLTVLCAIKDQPKYSNAGKYGSDISSMEINEMKFELKTYDNEQVPSEILLNMNFSDRLCYLTFLNKLLSLRSENNLQLDFIKYKKIEGLEDPEHVSHFIKHFDEIVKLSKICIDVVNNVCIFFHIQNVFKIHSTRESAIEKICCSFYDLNRNLLTLKNASKIFLISKKFKLDFFVRRKRFNRIFLKTNKRTTNIRYLSQQAKYLSSNYTFKTLVCMFLGNIKESKLYNMTSILILVFIDENQMKKKTKQKC
ncbi:hypothetical protein NGRA_1248 [Nosema granulosis]|uniref:Uncharacterized protein n=1 Tax=Nosema granulosis TaxID=83296 RepID=A0A9P6KYT0_9MICR|nr:hypothetical protein NGRA_1248 [Nosema granulosis]